MAKISAEFIRQHYRSGAQSYADSTKTPGLWAAEQYVFTRYLN